jgi:transposase
MSKRRNRVCGADVHRDLIVATIQDDDKPLLQEEFGTTYVEIKRFRDWLMANKCDQVAFEATGIYWIPICDFLSPSIDTIVANPWKIKSIPKDKTDAKDSQWIASLCLNGQIKKSRILSKNERDLRTMTRARSGYVKTRTQFRNRIHKYLASNGIKLSSCISDIFGESGRYILDGLVEGRSIDAILDGIPSGRVRKKRDLINAALGNGLDEISKLLIKDTLDLLDHLKTKVEAASQEVINKLQTKSKDLAIVMSIPGIGFVSGSVILAEIGDYHDFKTPEQLAKWCGLSPGENESAGKKKSCGITKQGSKYLRTVLLQIAHIVAGKGNTNLSRFFQRLSKRKEYNVAITALARKLICLVHHLLINQELYHEENREKKESMPAKIDTTSSYSPEDQLKDKVAAIVDAFYHLKARGQKRSSDGGG